MKITEIIDPSLVKIFTGVDVDSKGNIIDKPADSTGDTSSVADNGKTSDNGSSDSTGGKIVVVGDSLAVGTGGQIPGAIVDAKVGISSKAVLEKVINNKNLQGADLAIVSAGANDGAGPNGKNPNSQQTISNLQAIRKALGAKKYVWIVPYNKSVADDVRSAVGSDEVVDLSKTVSPGKDGVHPSSYGSVARSAIAKGGVTPGTPNKAKSGKGAVQKGGKNFVDPNTMKQYLAGKGYDKNSIAGILANAQAESSFNSGAYIASDAGQGQGGGLFGFHDPHNGKGEFTNMVNACGSNWQSNWQGQLDYMLRASGMPKTGFSSPGAAAEWIVTHYERPKYPGKEIAARSQAATHFA
jgi:lysophospholipase L1-like esterase